MKKLEAAVTAYVHAGTLAAVARDASVESVSLNCDYDWLFFHLGQDALISQADREFVADRLFDYALKYQYKPEILYRQQAYWYDIAPQKWDDVDATLRLRFAVFQASANALAPFVEKPAPAEPERQAETRTHGFERGFGDEDGGGRALKIGEERLPIPSPPIADIANRLGLTGVVADEARAPMPRENVYACPKCSQLFTTVDVDYGVTPFLYKCVATEGCDGLAESGFYPRGPRPDHVPAPSHEWYRPEISELPGLSPNTIDHVQRGGLLLRPRTDRRPVMGRPSSDDAEVVAKGVDALFGVGTFASMAAPAAAEPAAIDEARQASGEEVHPGVAEAEKAAAMARASAAEAEAKLAAKQDATAAEGTQVMDTPAAEVVNPPAVLVENVPHAIDPEGEHARPSKGKRRK